jgi:lipoic acid synthetase
VGIGEKDEEVLTLMDEVQQGTKASGRSGTKSSSRDAQAPGCHDACDILTIGQYLQPTRNHLPIDRWVTPEQFGIFKQEGLRRGFKVVESGPLVRSSYHADHQADVLTMVGRERESSSTS